MTTLHSLAELLGGGTYIAERKPRDPRQSHLTSSSTGWSPYIPCFLCGRSLPYVDAVRGASGDSVGYSHPLEGESACDPADVLHWQAELARKTNAELDREEGR